MSFKLVEKKNKDEEQNFIDSKDFFKKIRSGSDVDNSSPIKFDMDIFFLCLLVGLKENKKEDINLYKFHGSFSSKYIDSYLNVKPLITGLLLSKIMREEKIDKNEKDKIKKSLKIYLDTNDSSNLTIKCFDIMHEYFLGGYNILLKKFNFKAPDEISVFFDKYNKIIVN
jgi:hypothetical protein